MMLVFSLLGFADSGSAGKWIGALVGCALGRELLLPAFELVAVVLVGGGEFDVFEEKADALDLFLDFGLLGHGSGDEGIRVHGIRGSKVQKIESPTFGGTLG
jgi:hypothetical protein